MLAQTGVWVPLPGPQTQAFESQADVLLYGGAAGGGKSDLMLGKALTEHYVSIIFRRELTQLTGIIERLVGILGNKNGYNGMEKIWRLPQLGGRRIEFGACKALGDEVKYQGRPHSLKGFDELPHFAESQFRFLNGWKRDAEHPQIHKQTIAAGNPPTNAEGAWVIEYWKPWLDKKHENPAQAGELRWFARLDDKDVETGAAVLVPEWVAGAWSVEVDGVSYKTGDDRQIVPESRTFIPAKVEDNPYLMDSGYRATLQALPEPLRSQMLNGDFAAGIDDNAWQLIPTAWVEIAMQRWESRSSDSKGVMDSLGVDCARGGRDDMVIAPRHGRWFDALQVIPGVAVPDGPSAAGRVIASMRDRAVAHVDVIGIGSSVYDHLHGAGVQAVPVNSSDAATETDRSGQLTFLNKRSEMWWLFREALDPNNGEDLALPPDPKLKADLCAPRWKLTGRKVQVESKESPPDSNSQWGIKGRLGRSPDRGDAVVLAHQKTRKRGMSGGGRSGGDWRV